MKRKCEEDGTRLYLLLLIVRTRGSGHKVKQRMFSLNIGNFYSAHDWAQAKLVQRGCEVSLLRDTKEFSGHCVMGYWLLVALLGQWGWTSRGPFQSQAFCNFMIYLKGDRTVPLFEWSVVSLASWENAITSRITHCLKFVSWWHELWRKMKYSLAQFIQPNQKCFREHIEFPSGGEWYLVLQQLLHCQISFSQVSQSIFSSL